MKPKDRTSHSKMCRRMFLRGAGAATMAIPFLPSLLPRGARAQAGPDPKYVQISSSYTSSNDLLWPIPVTHEPSTPVDRLDDVTKRQRLSDLIDATGQIAPGLRGPEWEALAPWINLVVGSNLNCLELLHNSTAATTASGPDTSLPVVGTPTENPVFKWSIDYFAERFLRKPHHAFGALRVNLAYRHGTGYLHDEYESYCFGGPSSDEPRSAVRLPEMQDAAELELRLQGLHTNDDDVGARRKLIDGVLDDYRAVMRHPRISRSDRRRLEHAVGLWNDAANRLELGTLCNTAPAAPGATGGARADWRTYHRYAMDSLAYALACGLTPVVTYVLNHAGDEFPLGPDDYGTLHDGAHGGGVSPAYETMKRWRIDQLAYFASRLAELTDETGASLLDSTLMYWGHEYATPGNHAHNGHTSLLVGGAAGRLETSNFLDVLGDLDLDAPVATYFDGVPLNRIAVTVLEALGISIHDVEAITGQVGFGEYDGPTRVSRESRTNPHELRTIELSNEGRERYYTDAEKRKTLPIVRRP